MKAVLQRVLSASVSVDQQLVSQIGKGVLVFAAVAPDDTAKEIDAMADKILKYRMWPDEAGANWKRSVTDISGDVLCVSQFTLLANTQRGTKPDFHGAAGGEMAKQLYDRFFERVRAKHGEERVKDGVFQAMMEVGLVNDGPVTLELEVQAPAKAMKVGGKETGKGMGKENEKEKEKEKEKEDSNEIRKDQEARSEAVEESSSTSVG